MGSAICVHSYKGGTGKTLISSNLAVLLARRGNNVCLLDYDFRGPSLHILFKGRPKHWLNDFLNGDCALTDTLKEQVVGGSGELMVGWANPSHDAMRYMMTRDKRWEAKALNRILSAKRELLEDGDVDYLIFDSSPGIYYSSINAVAASDIVGLVMKYDDFDIDGTKQLITGIIDVLGRRVGIILNRVVAEGCGKQIGEDASSRVTGRISELIGRPIVGVIPCLWELQLHGSKELYALSNPNHLFVRILEGVADRITKL